MCFNGIPSSFKQCECVYTRVNRFFIFVDRTARTAGFHRFIAICMMSDEHSQFEEMPFLASNLWWSIKIELNWQMFQCEWQGRWNIIQAAYYTVFSYGLWINKCYCFMFVLIAETDLWVGTQLSGISRKRTYFHVHEMSFRIKNPSEILFPPKIGQKIHSNTNSCTSPPNLLLVMEYALQIIVSWKSEFDRKIHMKSQFSTNGLFILTKKKFFF